MRMRLLVGSGRPRSLIRLIFASENARVAIFARVEELRAEAREEVRRVWGPLLDA